MKKITQCNVFIFNIVVVINSCIIEGGRGGLLLHTPTSIGICIGVTVILIVATLPIEIASKWDRNNCAIEHPIREYHIAWLDLNLVDKYQLVLIRIWWMGGVACTIKGWSYPALHKVRWSRCLFPSESNVWGQNIHNSSVGKEISVRERE